MLVFVTVYEEVQNYQHYLEMIKNHYIKKAKIIVWYETCSHKCETGTRGLTVSCMRSEYTVCNIANRRGSIKLLDFK